MSNKQRTPALMGTGILEVLNASTENLTPRQAEINRICARYYRPGRYLVLVKDNLLEAVECNGWESGRLIHRLVDRIDEKLGDLAESMVEEVCSVA